MKLKLIFPPPFATTTRRILFLVPRDATAVKGTADAVVKKFCGAPWLSSSIKTDSIELWTEGGFLISPGDSSVIFDAPRGPRNNGGEGPSCDVDDASTTISQGHYKGD